MKNIIKITLIFFILVSVGSAQPDRTRENLNKNFLTLKYRLNYLQNLAEKYKASGVLKIINEARNTLKKGKTAFDSFNFPEAWKDYKKAFALANFAARKLLFKPFVRAKKDFERLISQAETEVQRSDNADARYMLTRARSFQTKAVKAYKNFQLEKGQEYQRIAIYFANRALQLAGVQFSNRNKKSNFREQLENLKKIYRNISSSKINNPEITRLMGKAFSYFQASKKYYEQGNSKQAFLRLQISERLLYRALDLQQGTSEGQKDQLKTNLSSLKNYINGIERNVNAAAGLSLLSKARQFMRSARRDYENGNYPAAQKKISLAQRMATKALHYASSGNEADGDIITEKVLDIRHIISWQKEKYPNESSVIKFLYKQAEALVKLAENAGHNGKYSLAFGELRLAFKMVNHIETLQNGQPGRRVDKLKLKNDLSRLRSDLQTLSQKQGLHSEFQAQLNLLNTMLKRAEQNYQQDKFYVARELTNLLQQQFKILLKEALNK